MTRVPVPHRVRLRVFVAFVIGTACGVAAGSVLGVAAGVLFGWGAFALTGVTWILLVVWPMDAASTRAHATAEDVGRTTARLIAVFGSLASLAALLVVIVQARSADGWTAFGLAGGAVVCVAASWLLIQADYMLRYARLYYADGVGSGILFNQKEDPEYTDFAYFAVGLGMTYQVADTNVTRNDMRRVVIAQTLLAYLFGSVILATIINLITGLG